MCKKKLLLFLFSFCFFNFSISYSAVIPSTTNFNNTNSNFSDYVLDPIQDPVPIQKVQDSIATTELLINYYSPKSGAVTLAWYSDNYPMSVLENLNNNTKIVDNLLYNPMSVEGDTFKLKLKVPINTSLNYYFWITKSKEGHYQDFWDLQSSGKISEVLNSTINKVANLSKPEEKKGSQIINIGWIILGIVVLIYIVLKWIKKNWALKHKSPTYIENTLFLGLSLFTFQVMARAEIIGVGPIQLYRDLNAFSKILKSSSSDLLFVSGLILLFLVILWLTKSTRIQKLLYGLLVILVSISTLIAFTNIPTVLFLGKPLNYQWLYYSDFLGSTDAKSAFLQNFSF